MVPTLFAKRTISRNENDGYILFHLYTRCPAAKRC